MRPLAILLPHFILLFGFTTSERAQFAADLKSRKAETGVTCGAAAVFRPRKPFYFLSAQTRSQHDAEE